MVAEVAPIDNYFNWSLNQLSKEFGIARETVGRRIRESNLKPAGERRGHSVYRVSDVARAILVQQTSMGGLINDPGSMIPKERSDWFKSENERLKFERDSGLSVGSDDARTQMAEVAKMGLQVLETLPDILERDFSLDSKIIAGVEERIDALREQWAESLEADV